LRLNDQGELAAARPFYERALEIRERVLGPDQPYTAQGLNKLARLLQAQGELPAARPVFERTRRSGSGCWRPTTPYTALIRANLAAVGPPTL
jgi:hypothetical protein